MQQPAPARTGRHHNNNNNKTRMTTAHSLNAEPRTCGNEMRAVFARTKTQKKAPRLNNNVNVRERT